MSIQSVLKWADEEILLLDFCDQVSTQLPTIVMVKVGFFGVDDYNIGSEEMFFVYGFERQKRVIVKDQRGKTYSIPANYKHARFQVCPRGQKKNASKAQSLEAIVKEWALDLNKRWIMVEKDGAVVYNRDVSSQESGELGILEVVEVFELNYALAHAMCADLSTKTIAIPDFMNISVCRATGAVYGSPKRFESWFKELCSLVEGLNHEEFKLDEDIILFDNYDYNSNSIRHYDHLNFKNSNQKDSGDHYEALNNKEKEENIYEPLPSHQSDHFSDLKVTCDFPYLPRSKDDFLKHCQRELPSIPKEASTPVRKTRIPTPVSDLEDLDDEEEEEDDDDGDDDDYDDDGDEEEDDDDDGFKYTKLNTMTKSASCGIRDGIEFKRLKISTFLPLREKRTYVNNSVILKHSASFLKPRLPSPVRKNSQS